MFAPTSRYANLETSTYVTADNRPVVYVRRRFLPPLSNSILTEYSVEDGDRIDNLTARYLGDPEQFWRVCDVNIEMNPDDLLTEVGRRIRIPSPLGG